MLVYFVSAAGCHCFDLSELDGFLCMVDYLSPRSPEILQFFSLASLHSKIERQCIFLLQFTTSHCFDFSEVGFSQPIPYG